MCQIAFSKSTEKVKEKKGFCFFGGRGCIIFLATVTAVTTVFFLRPQYSWKEQFYTFDNQCDALRAAFCDSCDIFFFVEVA